MSKVIQLFTQDEISNIDIDQLLLFKNKYINFVKVNPIQFPKSRCLIDQIKFIKRKNIDCPLTIGVYSNITILEAVNRIASDLVIINGLIQFVEDNSELVNAKFTLRLGTTHQPNQGDFTIFIDGKESEGEAFNVAPTFLKVKLRNTLNKWKNDKGKNKLHYIFVNEEAFVGNNFKELDHRVYKVKNWDK
ncbi:hypothetical protein [Chishuiella sp.]|uniref:hypothetical protein n=1 Tax=Chishuiella sp. TaxID=1969467 RepID=UPI0028B02C7A|nr:hypothetical protein [Chishuiella sp.]